MSIRKAFFLSGTLALALIVGTAPATTSGATDDGQITPSPTTPLPAQQLMLMPEFQPSPLSVPRHSGDGTAVGRNFDGWHYTVNYTYTANGWRFAGYTATRIDTMSAPQGRAVHSHHVATDGGMNPALLGSGGSIGDDSAPPIPGDFPPPPDPKDPSGPSEDTFNQCSWNQTDWNVQIINDWVPTRTEKNNDGSEVTIPGHWELKTFTETTGKIGACT